jgi:hypothetical protein
LVLTPTRGRTEGGSGLRDALLRFVHELSGFNRPSQAKPVAFDQAVEQAAARFG